jgi:hypothetical protein
LWGVEVGRRLVRLANWGSANRVPGRNPGSGAASVSKRWAIPDRPETVQAASTSGVGVSLAKEGTKRCQRPLPAWAMCVGPHLVPGVNLTTECCGPQGGWGTDFG